MSQLVDLTTKTESTSLKLSHVDFSNEIGAFCHSKWAQKSGFLSQCAERDKEALCEQKMTKQQSKSHEFANQKD